MTLTRFRGVLLLGALLLPASDLAAQQFFQERPGHLEFSGRMIVRPVQDGPISTGARSRLDGHVLKHFPEVDEYVIRVPQGMTPDGVHQWLMPTGDYEYVHPDWICYPLATPNDPGFGSQWHHQNMASEAGWDVLTDASSVVAAFTDTGVDVNHPDLVNNLIEGYNQVDGLWQSQGGIIDDINGHGTHVGGCIGAEGNNGIGVAGVAWKVQLFPIRVSNSSNGGAYLSDLTDAARFAVDNGASTVSASYSGVQNASVQTAGAYVKSQGGLYFYAADNSGTNHSGFDWADVVVVGATDSNDNKASWSSYGTAVDCVAPGVSIHSTSMGGGTGSSSGTSFATPLTNGVAAMIYARNPGMTAQQVEDRLYESCDDLGAAGEDTIYGWGRVNLHDAVDGGVMGSMDLTVGSMVAGTRVNFRVEDATPSAHVLIAYSTTGIGESFEPGAGITLAIDNHAQGAFLPTDAAGVADRDLRLPATTSGWDVWVQAVDIGNTSNVHAGTIQ